MLELGLTDYLDVALVALALYAVIVWLRRARAGLAVAGAMLLAAVYLAAREFGLNLTAWIFQGFFAAFLIVLIVLLQGDLRRLFERIALLGKGAPRSIGASGDDLDTLCSTVFELAGRKCGALIVLPGADPVERYMEGGERLDGRLSRSLLMSLFDPGSIGHDGAVVIKGKLVTQFATHLPLSNNFRQIQTRGTRHSAALGMSETTDALCIAVSEERGEVSIAREGRLDPVETIDELTEQVVTHAKQHGQHPDSRRFSTLARTWPEALLAMFLSIGLWQLFVASTKLTQKTVLAPVLVDSIDTGFEVEKVEPAEVRVHITGLRRDLYLLDPTTIEVRVDASLVSLGRRTFQLRADDVQHPPNLTIQGVEPGKIRVEVRSEPPPAPPADSAPPDN
jgi:diadenylate cyclase